MSMSSDEELLQALSNKFEKASGAASARSVRACEAEEEEEDDDDLPTCALCEESISTRDCSKTGECGMKPLHKSCYNALHSLTRMMKTDKVLKANAEKCRRKAPARFRSIALGLKTTTKFSRGADMRREATLPNYHPSHAEPPATLGVNCWLLEGGVHV